LLGEKILARKTVVSLSQVVIDPEGEEWSHALAFSLTENENKCRRIALVEALLIFNVSHISRKTERCKLASPIGVSPNCDCCTIYMSVGLNSKLLAIMGAL